MDRPKNVHYLDMSAIMFRAHLSIYKMLLYTKRLNCRYSLPRSIKTVCAIKWAGELGVGEELHEELEVEVTHN